MGSSPPTRVDDEVYEAAKIAAAVTDRSVAQQVSHWARLGREVEASAILRDHGRRVAVVLDADGDYDDLDADAQAVVRSVWEQRLEERLAQVDVGARRHAAGRSYVTVDADGQVVHRHPDGSDERL